MLRVLNEEEIRRAYTKALNDGSECDDEGNILPSKGVAKAQFKQDIEGFVRLVRSFTTYGGNELSGSYNSALANIVESLKQLVE
ncbi:unnamed protein product [marine sediment metagenome]|uniref:Uncharacterized protein n=1 Tax=marine sediment metagenome TaxID=412755 RepID=X1CQT9_9ZZZZ